MAGMRKLFWILLTLLGCGTAAAADDFLPMDQAFRIGAVATAPDRIEVIFEVHPGYYLYRKDFKFAVEEGQPVALGNVDLPKAFETIGKGAATPVRVVNLSIALGPSHNFGRQPVDQIDQEQDSQ